MKGTRLAAMLIAAALLLGGCQSEVPADSPTPAPTEAPTPEPTSAPEPTPTPEPEIPKTDFSAFKAPEDLEEISGLPDVFTMLSGQKVESYWDYKARMQEIRDLFQYYMYGFWPDRSEETVTYTLDGEKLTVTIERGGKTASFEALVALPDSPAPEGGYPVIIALSLAWGDAPLGHGIPYQYANDHGYAVISYNVPQVASDDSGRTGAFYELYPYNKDNVFEQTGSLMAWGWGGTKIIDALENGLGAETGISTWATVLTGVSRYGKAAFVAGAFDERIRVTMPACSGAGGASMYRYNPSGNVYDYSSVGGPEEKKTGSPERLSNVQGGFPHWFNDNLLKFKSPEQLPVDQHMLAALCATGDRALFIISETDNDWIGPAATYATFAAAKEIYDTIETIYDTDASSRIAINLHWTGHAVLVEDLEKALPFCGYNFYRHPRSIDPELQTTVYDLEVNRQASLDELLGR